MLQRALNI
jgi:hypothetical protein